MEIQRVLRDNLVVATLAVLAIAFGMVVVYGAVRGVSTQWIEDLILAAVLVIWGSQILARQRRDSIRAMAGGFLVVAGLLRAAVTLFPIGSGSTPIPELFLLVGLGLYLYDEIIR